MRINVYAEELPKERRTKRVKTVADTGRTFFGARIFLQSASSLHDDGEDDDRSAITFWGPRRAVAQLLAEAAAEMLPTHSNAGYRCPCATCHQQSMLQHVARVLGSLTDANTDSAPQDEQDHEPPNE